MPLPIDPEPAPEQAEDKPAPEDKPPEVVERVHNKEENVLKMNEALQRLALEKLRSQKRQDRKRAACAQPQDAKDHQQPQPPSGQRGNGN